MYKRFLIVIPIVMTTAYTLVVIADNESSNAMEYFLNTILPLLMAAVLTSIVTYIVSNMIFRKSQPDVENLLGEDLKKKRQEELNKKFEKDYAFLISENRRLHKELQNLRNENAKLRENFDKP